jgi:DNA-binding PucR family transcriptional regulator
MSRSASQSAHPLRRLLSDGRSADLVTVHGRYLVVLTTVTERSRVLVLCEAMRSVLAQNGMETGIAIGPTCRALHETRSSILTARHLLELLSPRRILWTGGLEPLALLFDSSNRERLDSFVQRTLAPLNGKESLMATLITYYDAAGNRTEAARKLGIHVNTLRGRLERIEDMVGGPVDEVSRALPLRLALLARGMAAGTSS